MTGRGTAAAFLHEAVAELRWKLGLSVLAAMALACAEGAGLLLLIPLLGSIGLVVTEGATSGLAATVQSAFAWLGVPVTLATVLLLFVLVSVCHAFIQRVYLLLNPKLEQQFVLALRSRLYRAIVRTDWSFFVARRATDFVHVVTTEVDRAGSAVFQLLNLIAALTVAFVYLGIAAVLSPALTSFVVATGLVILWWQRGRTRRSGELGETYADANQRQFHMASESIAALKVSRSFLAEPRDIAIFAGLARARSEAYLAMLRSFAAGKFGIDVASALVVSVLLLVAVQWLGVTGAALLVLLFAFVRLMPRVVSLQHSVQLVAAGTPSFRRAMHMIDECERHAEAPAQSTTARVPLRSEVRLESVTYAYRPDVPVLRRVSLSIPAGRTTAIVGASGAGKSTIADLLLGLLRPSSGAIIVDGRPLTELPIDAWRRSVAYVPQDSFLLHDTIRANLLWACPEATEASMWTALDRASAGDFVRARPEGLDTIAGDRGVQLSGGERQRIALARALLVAPDLLVLDEATSALDSANEQKILAAVAALAGRMTTLIITHRVAAIRGADSIHVLEGGTLVESGSWDALVARRGAFARMLEAQSVALLPAPAARSDSRSAI